MYSYHVLSESTNRNYAACGELNAGVASVLPPYQLSPERLTLSGKRPKFLVVPMPLKCESPCMLHEHMPECVCQHHQST